MGVAVEKPSSNPRHRLFFGRLSMNDRREKRKRWVRRGEFAVEVEVEVVYPAEHDSQACLEPKTVEWLAEIAKHAAADDVDFLRSVGRVDRVDPA